MENSMEIPYEARNKKITIWSSNPTIGSIHWGNHNWKRRMYPNVHCSTIYNSWRKQWHPTSALLPGKSHGQRSLVGCSPCGLEESDTTERLHFHFSLSCIGEGNGNPLQCSCLENPRDGGAWWAAVYGVAQSTTEATQQQQQDMEAT